MNRLNSWVEIKANSDFSMYNFPFGIYSDNTVKHHACSAIGNFVIDLFELSKVGLISCNLEVLENEFLNSFIELGKENSKRIRTELQVLFSDKNNLLSENQNLITRVLKSKNEVKLMLPVKIGDYTDFYSSIDHATNIGTMIRDPKNALLPNWKHLPVAYHGRASSICVSGHSFHRPKGQQKPADSETPVFGPTKALDIELEMAFVIGKSTQMGESISTEKADDYIFGMLLFNDWSARDIQTWEYAPLGPFLAKNFASTISPWIVTLDALEPFRTNGYEQEPKVLPYLQYSGSRNLDIKLDVFIKPENSIETKICSSNYKYMYWTMEQQLAHHTVNGCNINIGDMMASGTISGPEKSEYGSMMELTWRGTNPITLNDGSQRKYVNDLDTVILRGYCEKEGIRIGFGECEAKVLPVI